MASRGHRLRTRRRRSGRQREPVTVAELAEAAGVELVTGDENTDSADDSNEAPSPRGVAGRRGNAPSTES
jgi:hypothetical protein